MKSLTFSHSAITGFVLSLLGTGGLIVLSWGFGPLLAVKLISVMLAGAYCAYLLHCSPHKTGRVIITVAWLTATTSLFVLVSTPAMIAAQAAFIWLLRSLYFHTSAITSAADLALSFCAVGLGAWALQNSNWFLAFWSFFLVQSLAALIPRIPQISSEAESINPGNSRNLPDDSEQKFSAATANAQDALRRIHSF